MLFVGHGFHRKGLDRLIGAMAGVSDAHLVVVGGGDRRRMMRWANDDLARRVHFVGRVDDPERYYAEADLFVLPTRSDPWGIPLIEAMAAGVAAVTTRFAGAASVLADAGAGVVLPDESTAGLRETVESLIRDPARRLAMGKQGLAAAERFGPEAHAAAVLDTYRRIVTDAHSRRDGLLVS